MNYARCPNCKGRLGIPDKKRGLEVECPKCNMAFVPPAAPDPGKETSTISASKKPSPRAMPIPAAIATQPKSLKKSSSPDDLSTPDPLTPPKRVKPFAPLTIPDPPKKAAKANPLDPPGRTKPTIPTVIPASKSNLDRSPPGVETVSKPSGRSSSLVPASTSAPPSKPKQNRTVASIVKTESIQPQLTKDGTLPTLQLNDDFEAKPKEESKTNPAVLTAIICFSLLSSGMMLLMLGGEKSNKQERLEKTRQSIRIYYQIRPDQELKPYQVDLRQAQLAHSRGDYYTEIRAYENVMFRFRAEDLSEFSGLTGSPTSDRELEKWVSILLNEAKRQAKR